VAASGELADVSLAELIIASGAEIAGEQRRNAQGIT
jgi:hypothetical protein